jgi:hypothetical protein
VELIDIERNLIYHRIANMIDGTVHEIVEHDFQELKLATRDDTGGSMLGYRN